MKNHSLKIQKACLSVANSFNNRDENQCLFVLLGTTSSKVSLLGVSVNFEVEMSRSGALSHRFPCFNVNWTVSCCDFQTLHQFKFDFLQEVCHHEHFIPLCLPIRSSNIPGKAPLPQEDFCATVNSWEVQRADNKLLSQEPCLYVRLRSPKQLFRCGT